MAEVTENTVNAFVAELLRDKGVPISTEYSGKTTYGRRQPDFFIRNGSTVFGEGEWQSSFMAGLKQAHDFSNLPGASGSFLIAYPEKARDLIRKRLRDTTTPATLLHGIKIRGILMMKGQRAELFHGSINQAAQWLLDGLTKRPRTPDPGAFVSLMRDMVEKLSGYLPTTGQYPTFFEHIIATMPKDAGELETARRAAAYLLLNQLVFYRILSTVKYKPLDPDEIRTPIDLHEKYFKRVLEDNYAAIFSSEVAALFPDRSLQFIKDMVTYINTVQPESFTRDLLGSIFHELIPRKVRKSVAAFYTNPDAARLLAKLCIEDGSAKVADFACGSGTLLMAAYDRKEELRGNKLEAEDHSRFLEKDLTGFDIMPFAAHLAVVQLALRQPHFLTDKVRIAVQDSTSLKKGAMISPLESSMPQGQAKLHQFAEEVLEQHKIKRGAISGEGKGHAFKVGPLDVVMMNPPFTRKQLIGKNYRIMLSSRFKDYEDYESKEQSLFGYFIFLADRFLKPDGRLGFVLPTTAIRQISSEGMRQLIRDRYDLEFLIYSGHRLAFSEDAAFSEVLLIARKRRKRQKPKSHYITARIRAQPTRDNMMSMVSKLVDAKTFADQTGPTELIITDEMDYRVGDAKELEAKDWFPLLPGEEDIGIPLPSNFVELQEIVGDEGIIQGIRFEGSSDFVNVANTIASRRRDVGAKINWEIIRENETGFVAKSPATGAEVIIPWEVTEPACRTPAGLRTMRISRFPDFAINDRFQEDEPFWEGHDPDDTLRKRRPHFESRASRLVLAGRNHVNLVSDGTSHLAFAADDLFIPTWSFWSIKTPDVRYDKALALWFNSAYAFTHLYDQRIIGSGVYVGWLKEDLLKIKVPDLKKLTERQWSRVEKLYDELADVQAPSLYAQYKDKSNFRLKMDLEIADLFRLEEFNSGEKVRTLYKKISHRLSLIRETPAK